jgi:hypothetical protein
MFKKIILTSTTVVAFASGALAQLDHGDIALRVEAGVIQTGLIDEVSGEATYPWRVFAAELDETGFTNEPGFDSEPGTFAPASLIGVDILTNLRLWNGTDFSGASPSALRIRFGGLEAVTPPGDSVQPGFALSVSADGSWHRHLGYTLLAPADPGIYLLALRLHSTDAVVGPSEPFWLVFGNVADEIEHEAAVNWVRDNLVNLPCPADFNRDGNRDPDDLSDFITCFFLDVQFPAACPRADFNADGFRDPDDLSDFITAFFAGC